MNLFDPNEYPTKKPDEWYETYGGKIIGHVSLIRDMLNNDDEYGPVPSHYVPRVYFSIGSWVDDRWIAGISGGCGVLLSLDEVKPVPVVTIGDFQLFEELLDNPEDSVVVERVDLKEISLDTIGHIYGASAPPEMWHID